MDKGKDLQKAVKNVFDESAFIPRHRVQKLRNVESYLSESEQRIIEKAKNKAYMEFVYNLILFTLI